MVWRMGEKFWPWNSSSLQRDVCTFSDVRIEYEKRLRGRKRGRWFYHSVFLSAATKKHSRWIYDGIIAGSSITCCIIPDIWNWEDREAEAEEGTGVHLILIRTRLLLDIGPALFTVIGSTMEVAGKRRRKDISPVPEKMILKIKIKMVVSIYAMLIAVKYEKQWRKKGSSLSQRNNLRRKGRSYEAHFTDEGRWKVIPDRHVKAVPWDKCVYIYVKNWLKRIKWKSGWSRAPWSCKMGKKKEPGWIPIVLLYRGIRLLKNKWLCFSQGSPFSHVFCQRRDGLKPKNIAGERTNVME